VISFTGSTATGKKIMVAAADSVQLVASFAAVGLAGRQRHSRTCEAGWIIAKNGGYRVVEEDNIVSNAN
jgi:hypothetical protein